MRAFRRIYPLQEPGQFVYTAHSIVYEIGRDSNVVNSFNGSGSFGNHPGSYGNTDVRLLLQRDPSAHRAVHLGLDRSDHGLHGLALRPVR